MRVEAPQAITVAVRREGAALVADIEVRDAQGTLVGSRTISSRKRDCAELAAAVELAVAIIVDPLGPRRASGRWDDTVAPEASVPPPPGWESFPSSAAARPRIPQSSGAPEPSPAASASSASTVRAVPPGPAARTPVVFFAEAGFIAAIGAAPSVAPGGRVQLGVRRRSWSLALEARADVPGSMDVGGGRVSAAPILGLVVFCYQREILGACGLVGGGVLRGAGHDLLGARNETTPYGAAGARLTVTLPLGRRLALGAHADLLAPLQETALRVDGNPVWTSPPVCGALGLSLDVRFP